ncbi:TPA: LPS export ABC transporter permease LptG [Legionella feeleii]|nr:LPS export ABC transporter permease LptG [Legionella feeleii]
MVMKLLDRYIAKTVLAAIALVTLMLAGLQVFILFVNQLDDLGKGDYGIVQTALYVFLQMPYQVYLFFPMASLLGCLIGLGIMANHRELVVMRAAGMSIGQVTLAVLKAALFLILFVTLVGETIVPRLASYANDQKIQAMSGGQTLRTAHGVWLRHLNDFISIGTILPNNTLELVFQYHFDESHKMRFARHIDRINYVNGQWEAHDIAETIINNEGTQTRKIKAMPWDVPVKPDILSVSSREPDEMTLHELRQYLRAQKHSHQNVGNYQLAYWQRLIQPLTTVVMMILAIPFIFGPLRSSTMGSKLLAGATVGFGFHIVNRFFGPVSQVFQWPPEIAALGPTFIFALLGLYLMSRVR